MQCTGRREAVYRYDAIKLSHFTVKWVLWSNRPLKSRHSFIVIEVSIAYRRYSICYSIFSIPLNPERFQCRGECAGTIRAYNTSVSIQFYMKCVVKSSIHHCWSLIQFPNTVSCFTCVEITLLADSKLITWKKITVTVIRQLDTKNATRYTCRAK